MMFVLTKIYQNRSKFTCNVAPELGKFKKYNQYDVN